MQDSSVQEIARAEAEAERELRDAEWKDVLAYQAKERERERQSLAGRLAAAKAEQEVCTFTHTALAHISSVYTYKHTHNPTY